MLRIPRGFALIGIALNILAQLADFWTTKLVLDAGGVELNPVSAFIIDATSIYVWAVLKLAVVGWLLYSTRKKVWRDPFWLAVSLPFFIVAFMNWRLL